MSRSASPALARQSPPAVFRDGRPRFQPELDSSDEGIAGNLDNGSEMGFDGADDSAMINIAEDSITCLWNDCGDVYVLLPTLIDHIKKDHIGSNHSSYACEWSNCPRKGMAQTSKSALLSHMRSHTGDEPFVCTESDCVKAFTRSEALGKHMRQAHQIEPPPLSQGESRKRKRESESTSRANSPSRSFHGPPPQNEMVGPFLGSATPRPTWVSWGVLRTPELLDNEDLFDAASGPSQQHFQMDNNGHVDDGGMLKEAERSYNKRRRESSKANGLSFPPVNGDMPGNDDLNGAEEDDDELPPYLSARIDPVTGLIDGRSPAMVMYILTKAKAGYALLHHRELERQMLETEAELRELQLKRDNVLRRLLTAKFGDEAERLFEHMNPPGSAPTKDYRIQPNGTNA